MSMILIVTFVVVAATMLIEQRVSVANERWLRLHGAVEPRADVIGTMRWAYPASFAAMLVEGAAFAAQPGINVVAGAAVFLLAKALKYWAIASLGRRWSFRVLVLPGAPLVSTGPYAFVSHPNYIAVLGELGGVALLTGARVTGPIATVLFACLIRRRIRVEEAALRHPPCT
jgi:methyltransferase